MPLNSTEAAQIVAETVGQTTGFNAWISIMASLIALLPFILIFFREPIMNAIRFHTVGALVKSILKKSPGTAVIVFAGVVTVENANKFENMLRKLQAKRIDNVILILDTFGGYEFAMSRISDAIRHFDGSVHAYVPRYSMSAGTMIALSCKSIHMAPTSSLGPVDPQMGILFWVHSSKAWQEVVRKKGMKANDESIMMSLYAKQYGTLMRQRLDQLPLLNGNKKFKDFITRGEVPHAFQMNSTFLNKMGVRTQPIEHSEVFDIVSKDLNGIRLYPPVSVLSFN